MGASIEYTQLVKAFGQKQFDFILCEFHVLRDILPQLGAQPTYIPHTSW